LWEAVGTSTAGYFNGTELSAEVVYDREVRVVQVVPLKGGRNRYRKHYGSDEAIGCFRSSDRNGSLDVRMGIVTGQFEVLVLEIEEVRDSRV
jgi:hypothetical protein